MMGITEEIFEKVALAVHGTTEVKVGEHIINFHPPFAKLSITEQLPNIQE